MDPRFSHGLRAVIAAGVAVGSWRYAYQPVVRRYRSDTAHLAALTQQFTQIESMIQRADGQAAWLSQHRQRLEQLRTKFARPDQMPQLLNALVDTVQRGEFHVVNVTQGALEPVRQDEAPLLVDGLPCYRLPVTITAEGRYPVLLDALDRLTQEAFPAVVSVEQMDLRVLGAAAQLGITMRLAIYVIGAASASGPHA